MFPGLPDFILGSVVDDGVGKDSAKRGRVFLPMAIYRKPGIPVPAHEIPSSVICHYHHVPIRVMIYVN